MIEDLLTRAREPPPLATTAPFPALATVLRSSETRTTGVPGDAAAGVVALTAGPVVEKKALSDTALSTEPFVPSDLMPNELLLWTSA